MRLWNAAAPAFVPRSAVASSAGTSAHGATSTSAAGEAAAEAPSPAEAGCALQRDADTGPDIAIPANNKAKYAIGCLYYILARMVLNMRGTLPYNQPWDVKVDLFLYRKPEETEEEGEVRGCLRRGWGWWAWGSTMLGRGKVGT